MKAEFEALIRALQNLREISYRTGGGLAITSVRVITHSLIVRNRVGVEVTRLKLNMADGTNQFRDSLRHLLRN